LPTPTPERPVLALFLSTRGGCEVIYGDPEPSPARQEELRRALEHLRQALAALRRALSR
jgi:hypothetical protein